MTRPPATDPIPPSESSGGGPEFVKGYADAGVVADASSAGLPGIVVAIVLLPFVWVGSKVYRAARRR